MLILGLDNVLNGNMIKKNIKMFLTSAQEQLWVVLCVIN